MSRLAFGLLLFVGAANWCSQGVRVVRKPAEQDDHDDGAEVEALDRDLFVETDGLVSANASLIEDEATASRRRRRCSLSTPKRNRYAGGSQPARAYMIAQAHSSTQLESFSSTADVKWDSWWAGYVTRIEIDWRGNEVRRQCSCGTCDDYFRWAKRILFEATECRYPFGRWAQAFSVYDSSADHTYSFSTWTGRQFSRQDTVTESVGVSVGVSKGPFEASASYSYVAQQQTTNVWSAGSNTTHSWTVKRGESAVVWKYLLVSKCYNQVGMFLEELTYGTNIFHGTTDSRPPTCNPNTPGSCR